MAISFNEHKIRAGLPFIRLVQRYLPLSAADWFLKIGNARVRLGAEVSRETVSADGVSCEWIIPLKSSTDQVMLYLHGGGFVYGQTPLHLQMGAALAKKAGLRVLMVDYRTAPKHPFPAALDDCVTVYLWLLRQGISAQNIVVAGDSAGGNLTITMMMRLREIGTVLPAAAACLSPVTDLTPKDDLRKKHKDALISPEVAKFYNRSYIGKADARNPLISPVFGDLRGLPPLLVHAGEEEVLRFDAIKLASLAESAGVDVRVEIYPRMWHVWQLYLSLPQAVQSLDEIAHFFKEHLPIQA